MELRALERASLSSPNDADVRERLENAWMRSGRGWNGQRLEWNQRGNMAAEGERGVYRWLVAPLAALEIQFVYVPGGEIPCEMCHGSGWNTSHGYSGPEREPCEHCYPTPGRVKLEPFYIGRFPITWDQYRAFCNATEGERIPCFPWEELRPEHGRHPVVRVTAEDARDFCAWSGLRLPTDEEWLWAALGPPAPHDPTEHFYANQNAWEDDLPETLGKLRCLRCGDSGVGLHERPCVMTRRYPWGDADPDADRCVIGASHTAPVLERAKDLIARGAKLHLRGQDLDALDELHPSRPGGASWCGALDMAGNAWEIDADGTCHGGCYANDVTQLLSALHSPIGHATHLPRQDVGFRVALDAST